MGFIIKKLKEERKRRRKISEENRNKYWKLTASERLHYDSIRDKLNKNQGGVPMSYTSLAFQIIFYIFVFFFMFKFLLELDRDIFILLIPSVFRVVPLIVGIGLTIDLLIFFIYELSIKPDKFKKLNKRYGFKQI